MRNDIIRQFRENFLHIAEEKTGYTRNERGFLLEIKKSLHLPQSSTAQRWVQGTSMVRIKHLMTIYKHWGVTPNDLLGINGRRKRKKSGNGK